MLNIIINLRYLKNKNKKWNINIELVAHRLQASKPGLLNLLKSMGHHIFLKIFDLFLWSKFKILFKDTIYVYRFYKCKFKNKIVIFININTIKISLFLLTSLTTDTLSFNQWYLVTTTELKNFHIKC